MAERLNSNELRTFFLTVYRYKHFFSAELTGDEFGDG